MKKKVKRKVGSSRKTYSSRILWFFAFCILFSAVFSSLVTYFCVTNYQKDTLDWLALENNPHPVTNVLPAKTPGFQKDESYLVFNGPEDKKRVALTFDADMTIGMKNNLQFKKVASYYDKSLITILEKTKTKATLFLTGLWIETYPDATKQLAHNSLFELANHSYSHPSFSGSCYGLPQVPSSQLGSELDKTQSLLKKYTGKQNTLFRFPGGCFDTGTLELAHSRNLTTVQWDVVAGDGFNGNGQQILSNVENKVKNGSIIVMHMNGIPNEPETAAIMPQLIADLRGKGYEFVTVSELLE